MFTTSLKSLLKASKPLHRGFYFQKYQRFSSNTREVLKVRMDLFQGQDKIKQFIINQNQNLKQVEEVLKEDNPNIKSIKFLVGDQEVQNMEELSFLNLSLNNNLKIVIDNVQTTYQFDDQLNTANYFEETRLEGELAQHEVPFQDAQVIQAFIKNQGSHAYSEKQLNDALVKAISTFSEFNYQNNFVKNTQLAESLRQSYDEEKAKVTQIEEEARAKSTAVIKKLIGLQLVQFGFLFYLTYGLYGWDFAEPVSYILGLSTEAVIFYYFIKHRKGLNSSLLFGNKFDPLQKRLLSQNYTSAENQLKFLKNKLDMTESKISFGRSKEK